MFRWEYKSTSSLSDDDMNMLGHLGWELVAVYPAFRGHPPMLKWKRAIPTGGR